MANDTTPNSNEKLILQKNCDSSNTRIIKTLSQKMLYLARKVGESIIIDNNIEIEIIQIKGNTVRIGIKSSKDISIFRKEIYEKIIKENMEAKDINELPIDVLKKIEQKNGNR